MMPFCPNNGKKLIIETEAGSYARFPVKTHVVMAGDNLFDMMDKYIVRYLEEGDMVFISEKIVAISQGRAFPIDEIKPSFFARLLCKFVIKTPYGIGLGSPWTMELAIKELGLMRILFAAFFAAITKPFGIKGVFYKICGDKARAIDGPCDYTLPPYNHYAKLAPDRPNEVAAELMTKIGCNVVIIDANDLGVEVLGRSSKELDVNLLKSIFKDNPLDQADQQTPLCIIRKIEHPEELSSEEELYTCMEQVELSKDALNIENEELDVNPTSDAETII